LEQTVGRPATVGIKAPDEPLNVSRRKIEMAIGAIRPVAGPEELKFPLGPTIQKKEISSPSTGVSEVTT
jgi:hypothetical protein